MYIIILIALVLSFPLLRLLLYCVVIMSSLIRTVRGMKQLRLSPVEPDQFTGFAAAAVESHSAFASRHGFTPIGFFNGTPPGTLPLLIGAWQRDTLHLCCYVLPWPDGPIPAMAATDLVTTYSQRCALTTANSESGIFYPAPSGIYRQSFPDVTLEEMLRRHLEADAYLRRQFLLRPELPKLPLPALMESYFRAHMEYVTSHVMWPVRCLVWYLRRGRNANKTIEQQNVAPPPDALVTGGPR
jgi:hypothetical protein